MGAPAKTSDSAFQTPGLTQLVEAGLAQDVEKSELATQVLKKYIFEKTYQYSQVSLEFAKAWRLLVTEPIRHAKDQASINSVNTACYNLTIVWKYVMSQALHLSHRPMPELKQVMRNFIPEPSHKPIHIARLGYELGLGWTKWLTKDPDATTKDLENCLHKFHFDDTTITGLWEHPSASDSFKKLLLACYVKHHAGLNWAVANSEVVNSPIYMEFILRNYPAPSESPSLRWPWVLDSVPEHIWPTCVRTLLAQKFLANSSIQEYVERAIIEALHHVAAHPSVRALCPHDLKDGLMSQHKDIRLATVAVLNQLTVPGPEVAPLSPVINSKAKASRTT